MKLSWKIKALTTRLFFFFCCCYDDVIDIVVGLRKPQRQSGNRNPQNSENGPNCLLIALKEKKLPIQTKIIFKKTFFSVKEIGTVKDKEGKVRISFLVCVWGGGGVWKKKDSLVANNIYTKGDPRDGFSHGSLGDRTLSFSYFASHTYNTLASKTKFNQI